MGKRRGLLVQAVQEEDRELGRRHQRAVVHLTLAHLVAEPSQQHHRLLQCSAVVGVQAA